MSTDSKRHSVQEIAALLTNPGDKWEGEASDFWSAAHTACNGNRDDMFDWMEAVVRDLVEQLEASRLLIARQLTTLDVAATHIEIIRSKGDEYTPKERDNVAAIVESHVKEARAALFTGISNPASEPEPS